mmetsp:Transcript_88274/g.129079  ORF Transcript_88274/g.129079 Transcript_88274/m.129079 type:complete len:91 (+) Transcript_88274:213-485(+)
MAQRANMLWARFQLRPCKADEVAQEVGVRAHTTNVSFVALDTLSGALPRSLDVASFGHVRHGANPGNEEQENPCVRLGDDLRTAVQRHQD